MEFFALCFDLCGVIGILFLVQNKRGGNKFFHRNTQVSSPCSTEVRLQLSLGLIAMKLV